MPHTKEAFKFLEGTIEEIRDVCAPRSLLYIGWRSDANPWWYDKFCKDLNIERVSVLEIFRPNFLELERRVSSGRYQVRPILGNVLDISKYAIPKEYDIIFWDHGPEHVIYNDLVKITPTLSHLANKLLLYCCPWGEWNQDAEGGNDWEQHRTHMTKDHLRNLGMTVNTFNGIDQRNGGEIVAVKLSNSEVI